MKHENEERILKLIKKYHDNILELHNERKICTHAFALCEIDLQIVIKERFITDLTSLLS